MRSIRQQLLVLLAAILIATFSLSGLLGYLATAEEVQELFDAQLIENARVLKGVMNHSAEHVDWEHMRESLEETRKEEVDDDDPMAAGHAYEKKVAIQVWTADGNLVLRSPSAPEYSLSPLRHGFYTRDSNGHKWFAFTTRLDENGHWLIVAERSDVREELARNVAASLGIGALAGLALALWLMRRGLSRELKPLADLQAAIGQRDPDKLAPITLDTLRAELEPVVGELNHLLARVSAGMERERRFLADAAHELRTPLAVLKLKAQLALRATSPEEAREHIERLIGSVDRSARVVDQLLLLARLDADAVPATREPVALDVLARDILASVAPLAQARRQELVLEAADGTDYTLQGNGALLGALLRNLVDNAMRHSPDDSEIHVTLEAVAAAGTTSEGGAGGTAATDASGALVIKVRDAGPGVDPVMLGQLTRRFVRAHQADTQGTGLGLAIVAHIVELHRGELHLENLEPSGLQVCITLPRA